MPTPTLRDSGPSFSEYLFLILGSILGAELHACATATHPSAPDLLGHVWAAVGAFAGLGTFVLGWRALNTWRHQRDDAIAHEALVAAATSCDALRSMLQSLEDAGYLTSPKGMDPDYVEEVQAKHANKAHADRLTEATVRARVRFGDATVAPLERIGVLENRAWNACSDLRGKLRARQDYPAPFFHLSIATLKKLGEESTQAERDLRTNLDRYVSRV